MAPGFSGALLSRSAVKVDDGICQSNIVSGKIIAKLVPKMGLFDLDVTAIAMQGSKDWLKTHL